MILPYSRLLYYQDCIIELCMLKFLLNLLFLTFFLQSPMEYVNLNINVLWCFFFTTLSLLFTESSANKKYDKNEKKKHQILTSLFDFAACINSCYGTYSHLDENNLFVCDVCTILFFVSLEWEPNNFPNS